MEEILLNLQMTMLSMILEAKGKMAEEKPEPKPEPSKEKTERKKSLLELINEIIEDEKI